MDVSEKSHGSTESRPTDLRFALGGIVVALCLAILTIRTWRKWGDMVVDFGVQLYVPWKLSTGAVLYRDLAYLTGGPLSQYYHAWLFRIFGVSVLTIVLSNLVILVFLAGLIYVCFYRIADVWTATLAGLALVLVFAFEHYSADGIFNFISPYSHEVVHGVVLSIAVLWLLSQWLLNEKIGLVWLAGAGEGLVLLTKPEVFLALGLAHAAALVLFWRRKHNAVLLVRPVLATVGGAVLAPAVFFLYFIQHENFAQSLRSVLWAWAAVLAHRAPDNYFYRWCLGFDEPRHHLKMIVFETTGLAVILAGCAALCRIKLGRWLALALLVLMVMAVAYLALDFSWIKCGYCLPALCLTSLGLILWRARKAPEEIQPFPLLWGLFGLALLAKLGLFPRVWHYGFALAMPAFLDGVYLLTWQLPSLLESYGGRSQYFRAVISLGLLVGFVQLWQNSQYAYDQRTVSVACGADRMLVFAPSRSVTMGCVADWIETNTPPHCSLAVLPEGSMLNYLSRRENPTGYLRWNLTESTAFGQKKMDGALMRAQPDFIVLIRLTMDEFGLKPFGEDPHYEHDLKEWIEGHYKVVYADDPPLMTVYQRQKASDSLTH